MAKKFIISEIFLLRSIACLAVVLLHSISRYKSYESLNSSSFVFWDSFELLLKFGTPTFIFISELLIAKSYSESVPKGFLFKRFKLIMIPYLAMAVFYALYYSISDLKMFLPYAVENIFGGYHGYFVLIIFQFYLLHLFFIKYLKDSNPKVVLLVSLIINVAYLSIFNFIKPATDNDVIVYFWERGHWMPFTGWLFYFSLAFYAGRYYEKFKEFLLKYKKVLYCIPVFMGAVVVLLNYLNVFENTSKRIDMIFFTVSMIFVIYLIGMSIKEVPIILVKISQYSFGIYLLHMFYQLMINRIVIYFDLNIGLFYLFTIFIGSIIASIISVYFLNKVPFGQYVAGKVGIGFRKQELSQTKKAV